MSEAVVAFSARPQQEPDDVRQRLVRDGYVRLERPVEPALAGRLGVDVRQVLDRIGWLPGGSSETSVTPKLGRQEGSEGWWAGYTQVQALERFHRFPHTPAVERLRAAFFPTSFVHVRKVCDVIYPQFAVPAHQDFPAVQGAVDTLTLVVRLGSPVAGSSQLRVVPGSHRRGVLPMRQLPQAGVTLADTADLDWTAVDLQVGDIVLLHSLTVHELTPNRSTDVDLYAEYRIQDARDPVGPASLIPHHYPRVPAARELSRGWGNRRWIRRPLIARERRFVMPPDVSTWHTLLDASESRLLAG